LLAGNKEGSLLKSRNKEILDADWIPSSTFVSLIVGATALFGPVFFFVGANPHVDFIFEVYALFWQLSSQGGPLVFIARFSSANLLFMPLRFSYVWQLHRCYNNRTSKRLTLVVGLMAELQTLVTLFMLSYDPLSPYPQLTGPVPLLYLMGVLFLITVPPRKQGKVWSD
jgi:hypothetical protein